MVEVPQSAIVSKRIKKIAKVIHRNFQRSITLTTRMHRYSIPTQAQIRVRDSWRS